ncbi:neuronal acetylcholine receptor subunit alpha-9-like [Eurytemora carolleeae]|uniref:neuronal acetylcholine receptor subunit alpha-9-like n=1 Tax=Eurytemora carolleeae TaxID=1294199 RepID=UPI000C776507|nr:neuronal acetylcholine receptor subunit alpha-9-like [Eurytemora carolleeae]|eukprot:XP_023332562.1 neuronal acetylcholine receptor subunit alpha-9-like [Eurytemora affinis]
MRILTLFSFLLQVCNPAGTERPNKKLSSYRREIKTADYRLSTDLLNGYPTGYNILPVVDAMDIVNVSIQLALYHIVDMNERDQTLTTSCEIITRWHDAFLMWDPEGMF